MTIFCKREVNARDVKVLILFYWEQFLNKWSDALQV